MRKDFGNAFEACNDELFRHASMRLKDRERAIELTQECFMKVWQFAQKGGEIRELRPFLYRTLRHLIIDEYRKKKSFSLDAIIENDEGGTVEALLPRDETNTLEAALDRHEGTRAILGLQKLPDLYREVIAMRYVDDLSLKEIAVLIEESENVVSVRLHRGLRKLRELLDEESKRK